MTSILVNSKKKKSNRLDGWILIFYFRSIDRLENPAIGNIIVAQETFGFLAIYQEADAVNFRKTS